MSERLRTAPRTLAAQALGKIDEATRALVPPLHVATTFLRDPDNAYRSGNVYGRPDNETVREAEAVIGALEGATTTLVFGSGMSAAIALFLSLPPGAHIVAPRVMYWALRNWLANEAPLHGLEFDFVDTEDIAALAAAIRPSRQDSSGWRRRAIRCGASPTSPKRQDSPMPRARSSRVDSTCATPIFTRPLELGADVVMHSATKYLNGHSDVIAGALGFARDDALFERVRRHPQDSGLILGPFEAFLLIRGLRTLDLACALGAPTRPSSRRASPIIPRSPRCSIPACPHHPGHETARAPDARRLWRHAVDPRARRRGGGDRDRGADKLMEARDLARRRRVAD